MINASKEFKEKLKNGANLVNYADITLSDGTVLNLTYKDFMIGGCQIEDKTTDGKFGVGYAIGKTLSIKLENKDERFSKYDFYQSIINLYVAMALDNGSIEKIRKGVFFTVVPETPGDIIEISAVDGMYLLDKDYSPSTTSYPATLQRIVSDACLDCGIPIGFRQFDNMNFTVYEKPEKITYRQAVSYACQIAGYNAHIDNNGYMQLIWYNSALLDRYNYNGGNFKTYQHDTVIDGGNFTDYSTDTIISGGNFTDEVPEHIFRIKSLNVSTDDVQITGVKVVGDDKKEALFGETGYVIEVSGNSFVNGKEQEIADYLGRRIVGMVFRPFSASILGNPLYEPFEVVRVSERKGNVYNSVINSVSYKIGGYTQVACQAEDPARNGSRYVSAAAQAVVEARRNTEKQLTTYDKAVQNMNQLAANAMGLYRESEVQPDGSYIYYQSNKPITKDENGKCQFEENSVVYKSAAEGFFVSTDGGESFASGFDSQGNVVVNVVSAIGMTFDWAHGGTLTLGGDNNINGEMIVYDSESNIVGKFNKDGLWASNGYFEGTIKSKNAYITGGQINITTAAQTYDTIKLNYGNQKTDISPNYVRLTNGISEYSQYSSFQISLRDVGLGTSINAGSITMDRNGKNTHIQGDAAVFGGDISVLGKGESLFSGNIAITGNLRISGEINSAITHIKSKVQIDSGSLELTGTAVNFLCRGKAEFYNGIYEGTAFSVDTVGNVTANGIIKSTGNYTSSFYSIEARSNLSVNSILSVNGSTNLKGSVKIGGGISNAVGFFGSNGSNKKTVATITTTSSATSSLNATKINEIINALKSYNLL